MNNFKKENITSIGELNRADGGRVLTPIFKGRIFPNMVIVTAKEFQTVRGNKELMKELAIKKLNEPK